MSDQNEQTGGNGPSELDLLKQRARLMGISFSNNIGLDALKAKVNAKAEGEPEPETDDDNETEDQDPAVNDTADAPTEPNGLEAAAAIADQKDTAPAVPNAPAPPATPYPAPKRKLTAQEEKIQLRAEMVKEQLKLVRCRIQNLDPKKANLPGEIFTVANKILGTVRKFVPYGEVTDDGYHIPYIIYKQLEARRFLNIRTSKKNGQIQVHQGWAKEFALEVLPPLTQEELNRLASAQIAAGSVEI